MEEWELPESYQNSAFVHVWGISALSPEAAGEALVFSSQQVIDHARQQVR